MAKKWKTEDSSLQMTNKYNDAVEDIDQLYENQTVSDKEIANLTRMIKTIGRIQDPDMVSSRLSNVGVTIPLVSQGRTLVYANADLKTGWSVLNAIMTHSDGTEESIPIDGIELLILPQGLYIENEISDYEGLQMTVIFVNMQDGEEVQY